MAAGPLRFRGDPANPNHAAVRHLMRVYAAHLGLALEEAPEGPADIVWGPAGQGPAAEAAVAEAAVSEDAVAEAGVAEVGAAGAAGIFVPARPEARPDLDIARARDGFPMPRSALRPDGSSATTGWDVLSFCADILFRRADFLPGRERQAREALGRGEWDEAAGLGEAPWVDRWMFRLLARIPRLAAPIAELPRRASAWLTHDLDNLAKWRPRSVAGQILRTPAQALMGRFALLARNWGEIAARVLTGKDPFDTMDAVLEMERGRRSANFFLANGRDHLFHRYDLRKPRFRRVLAACRDAGMAVGLHGQVRHISEPAGIAAEKRKLEGLLGAPVLLNRQHYLRWDPRATFPALEAAGIRVDSTLGYNDMPGFRCGTALPFPWFDCAAGRPLRLLVVPLVLAEFQFYDPGAFDGGAVRAAIRRYQDAACAQGGVFTTLFHNEYFHDAQFPGHGRVYADMLAGLRERGLPDFDPLAVAARFESLHG